MKTRNGKQLNRIALLITILLVMLLACGCRTRITNNDVVSNVMYDEDGYLSEEYQMRRDELGLSTAEKPIFTGLGSSDDESYDGDYYDGDSEALGDYDSDDYDDYDDDDDEDDKTTAGSTRKTTGTTPGTRRIVPRTTPSTNTNTNRNPSNNKPETDKPQSTGIEVTLNANGGKCSTSAIKVTTGGKYGSLPTPTRDGYKFSGWYTQKAKGKGSKVTASTKVTRTVSHTLYAHWKEVKEEKEEDKKEELYTVVYTDGVGTEDVFKDEKFTDLREGDATPGFEVALDVREGYEFAGWSPEVTSTVSANDADSNNVITYTAKWNNLYDRWAEIFKQAQSDAENDGYTPVCYLVDSGKAEKEQLVRDDCKGSLDLADGEEPEFIIAFGDINNVDADAIRGDYDTARVIVIPEEAVSGKTDPNLKLYYKMLLINELHGSGIVVDQAAADLGMTGSIYVDGDIIS